RERSRRDDIAIGFGDRVEQQAVADKPFIHKYIDRVAVELLQLGPGEEAAQAQAARLAGGLVQVAFPWWRVGQAGVFERGLGGYRQELAEGFGAEDLVDALGRAGDGRRLEQGVRGREEL